MLYPFRVHLGRGGLSRQALGLHLCTPSELTFLLGIMAARASASPDLSQSHTAQPLTHKCCDHVSRAISYCSMYMNSTAISVYRITKIFIFGASREKILNSEINLATYEVIYILLLFLSLNILGFVGGGDVGVYVHARVCTCSTCVHTQRMCVTFLIIKVWLVLMTVSRSNS